MMKQENQDPWTQRLSEYLDGELTADEALDLSAHLEGCTTCAPLLAELQQVVSQLRVAGTEREAVPPNDVWHRISRRLPERASGMTIDASWLDSSWTRRALVGGLLFLLGLLSGIWLGGVAARSRNGHGPGWTRKLVPGLGMTWTPPVNGRLEG